MSPSPDTAYILTACRECEKDGRDEMIIGLDANGDRVAFYWSSLDDMPSLGYKCCLTAACPDLGTETCLACELADGKARDNCDFQCARCLDEHRCACSREGWLARQRTEGQDRSEDHAAGAVLAVDGMHERQ